MKTYVIGDIHGTYKALLQCLERSGFSKEEDTLIQLGDVVDGYSESFECVEELLTIPNLISIKGNHDDWFLQWIEYQQHGSGWKQGAFATLKSYGFNCLGKNKFQVTCNISRTITNLIVNDLPKTHIKFFKNQLPYYILHNTCFVHAGFNRFQEFERQKPDFIYWWDRDLWMSALSFKSMIEGKDVEYDGQFNMKTPFKEVFIGHTSTVNWTKIKEYYTKDNDKIIYHADRQPITTPMNAANIWNLDTGAGFKGKLTIMDIETKEYWQSDDVQTLYPNEKSR